MSHSNAILTAIVQGMRKEEQNLHVKLAATNAMLDTLEFSKDNFDQEVIFASCHFCKCYLIVNLVLE